MDYNIANQIDGAKGPSGAVQYTDGGGGFLGSSDVTIKNGTLNYVTLNPPIYTGISASASMVPTTSNINAINSYNKTNFNKLYFLDYPDTYSNGAAPFEYKLVIGSYIPILELFNGIQMTLPLGTLFKNKTIL